MNLFTITREKEEAKESYLENGSFKRMKNCCFLGLLYHHFVLVGGRCCKNALPLHWTI